jgi:hypothetical protein
MILLLPLMTGCSEYLSRGVASPPAVELWRTPAGGIQPRAAVDAEGVVHLVFVDAETDRVLYARRGITEPTWSASITVSEERPRSNFGAISTPKLALGIGGRPHVVWYHSDSEAHYHARLSDDGSHFEDPVTVASELQEETGPAVTANGSGQVVVTWHAGNPMFESKRTVWVAVSGDGGETFTDPRRAITDEIGACGCCSLDASLSGDETIYVSYRTATENIHRDMTLLVSKDGGSTFNKEQIHPWEINACPVSTTTVAGNAKGDVAVAWETKGRLYFARAGDLERAIEVTSGESVAAEGSPVDRLKNPAVAVAPDGRTLMAWGSGRGWRTGGLLGWQLFDAQGHPLNTPQNAEPIADQSLPTAVALPDGGFVVVY